MKPIIKAIDVQYCTLQCPDLDIQEQFLIHFGMHTVEKNEDTLIMRGEGPKPFIEICKKGERKFLGSAFLAASMDDLEKISKSDAFSEIEKLSTPGGGFVSKGIDPDGINIEVVFGIDDRADFKEINPYPNNEGTNSNRVNELKRYEKGKYPRILRFAHYGINVKDVAASLGWYNKHLGIIPSDKLWLGEPNNPETPLNGIFARLDKGKIPTDHHSIFFLDANMISQGKSGLNHVSFEMLSIDDVFRGHEILQKTKEQFDYELEWGVGRHYQGSQVFDYWRNPFKQTHEHQTDGDVLDNTVPHNDLDLTKGEGGGLPEDGPGPSQWGPSINFTTFGDERGL